MDFSRALEELKKGKKVTKNTQRFSYLKVVPTVAELKRISSFDKNNDIIDEVWSASTVDFFSNDWEIIEEIPEVELHRSIELYFNCPKCSETQEQLIYPEDDKHEVKECRFCGQKFRFSNLEEMKKMYYEIAKREEYEAFLKKIEIGKPVITTIKYAEKFGELPEFYLKFPSLDIDTLLKPAIFRVISSTPEQTTIEFYKK